MYKRQTGSRTITCSALVGDTDGNKRVDLADLTAVRTYLAPMVTASTAVYDVNRDGRINSGDQLLIRARIGNTVP